MADPKVEVKVAVKLAGKTAPKALKTFEWKESADSTKITFLKGKKVEKLPANLVAKYRKIGLVEPEVKEED
jgi:hypothetical protein